MSILGTALAQSGPEEINQQTLDSLYDSYEDFLEVTEPEDQVYDGDTYDDIEEYNEYEPAADYYSEPLWDTVGSRPQDLISEAEWNEIVGDRRYKKEKKEEPKDLPKYSPGLNWGSGFLSGLGTFAWIAIVVLIGGVLIYFIYNSQADTSKKMGNRQFDVTDELLSSSPQELQSALSRNLDAEDYRNAIRYRFGQVLQELRDDRLITWAPGRTNADYLTELPPALQPSYEVLAKAFSFAFYSGRIIGREHYDDFEVKAAQLQGFRQNQPAIAKTLRP